MHFTLFIENECAEMRRETALGNTNHERQMEFITKISGRGEALVHVATSGFPMSDELKARVLSTLLTLMNTRENRERAMAGSFGPLTMARPSAKTVIS